MKKILSVCILSIISILFVFVGIYGCGKQESGNPIVENKGYFTDSYLLYNNISLKVAEKYLLKTINSEVLSWTSSDDSIATVVDGVIEGKGSGVAFITANTKVGETHCCVVTVTEFAEKPDIKLSSGNRTILINDCIKVVATVQYDEIIKEENVEWNVADDTIVEVKKNCNEIEIIGLTEGRTLITATLKGSTSVLAINVEKGDLEIANFDNPPEMQNVRLSKVPFEKGIKNVEAITGNKVSLFKDVYFGTSEESKTLTMFATLKTSNRAIVFENKNHFAYGFIVETIQIKDSSFISLQDNQLVYYSTATANSLGNYGIMIKNIPDGYYAVRAFVEYEEKGIIKRETSSNRITTGNFDPKFVSSEKDFGVASINVQSTFATNSGFVEHAISSKGNYKDSKDVVYPIKYEVDVDVRYNAMKTAKVLQSVMARVQTPMTKNMFKELSNQKLSLLKFNVCYLTEKDCSGILYTMDLLAVNDSFYSRAAYTSDELVCSEEKARVQRDLYMQKFYSAYRGITVKSNTWYTISYDSAELYKDYDILFDENNSFPLFSFAMSNNEVLDGEDGSCRVLITDFEFENISYDNLFPNSGSYAFYLSRYGHDAASSWKRLDNTHGCEKVEATASGTTYTDEKGITKNIIQSFEYPIRELHEQSGRFMLMGLDNKVISKALLENLVSQGYKSLSFSFVYHSTYSVGLKIKTLNIDYLRKNTTSKVVGRDLWINEETFSYASNLTDKDDDCRNWHTVKYQLKDLIECYDQIFSGPYVVFAMPVADYVNTEPSYFYISEIAFNISSDNPSGGDGLDGIIEDKQEDFYRNV